MNVLIVAFEFPPQSGGIGTYSFQVARYLALFGNNVTVLALSRNVSSEDMEVFDNSQTFQIIRYSNPSRYMRAVVHRTFLTWKTVRSGDYDLIFVPSPNAAILGWLFRVLYRIPYALMAHGSEFLYSKGLYKLALKLAFNRASLVFSNSRYTVDLMARFGIVNKNILTIPLGADDERFDREKYDCDRLRERYNLEGKNIVLTVGRLTERKGHRTVILAIEKLKDEIPDLTYLIVGEGEEKDSLQKLIDEKRLQNHVRLIDFIPTDRLVEYYAMCDVFILNSTIGRDRTTEGFGIVLIEAGLMGKPVIGTKGSGIDDALEPDKSGLLISRDSVDETVGALKKLLTDPRLSRSMGEYGYRRAKSNYTWKSVVAKKEARLKKIVEVDPVS
jgi:phosphatidylinositol alpha-1,6-mannosyltransferase